MYRASLVSCLLVVILFVGTLQAQSRLSIRAASVEPVEGWQVMQVEHCQTRCTVWVSPTEAVTGSDIEQAQPETTRDGRTRIAVVFTDAGAHKIRDLSIAQRGKLVALVVGDRVIWAPTVNAEIAKKSVLMGNGQPNGSLTEEEVERIMTALH
jgi:preprotein translocase subunit SecD